MEFSAGTAERAWSRRITAWKTGCAARSARRHIRSAGGGIRTSDGRLWFTTGRGLAVLDPDAHKPPALAPVAHIVQMTANGEPVDLDGRRGWLPGTNACRSAIPAIHLSAPERVQYFYRLEAWIAIGCRPAARRVINFNSLHHGHYRFIVRAELPGGPASEQRFEFEVLPQFWETAWFRALCVAALLAARVGGLPVPAAADPLALWARAGRARAAGARNPRHAGAGLRGNFVATGRGGDVHAGGGDAGAVLSGYGAAHGAA